VYEPHEMNMVQINIGLDVSWQLTYSVGPKARNCNLTRIFSDSYMTTVNIFCQFNFIVRRFSLAVRLSNLNCALISLFFARLCVLRAHPVITIWILLSL
jgi:hypothetical protein